MLGQRDVVILEDLEPERSYNFSLNYNQVYTGFNGSGSFDIEAFYTHFTNKIIPDYDQQGLIIYENTDGWARTMGISANVNHNFKFPVSLNLGLNILNSTETEYDEDGVEVTENLLYAPRMSTVLTVNYQLAKQQITFAYTAQYTGVMALPEVYELDETGTPVSEPRPLTSKPFSLHQVQISKDFNSNYTLYLGANNLFNFVQKESPLVGHDDPNYAPGFSPYFDTSYVYAPNHGREFYIGFKWNLNRSAKNQVVAER